MDSWRSDIGIIKETLTGIQSKNWKSDLIEIAKFEGHSSKNWREAVKNWANAYGVTSTDWRNDIIILTDSLTGVYPKTWKDGLHHIRNYYEGEQPEYVWNYKLGSWKLGEKPFRSKI